MRDGWFWELSPMSATTENKGFNGKADLARTLSPRKSTRSDVAKEAKLPERKIRLAQEIKRVDPLLE
jgi:hypothetical protein